MALPPHSIALLLSPSEEEQTHEKEPQSRYARAYQCIRQLRTYVINMIRRSRHGRNYRGITDGRGVIAKNRA